MIAVSGLLVTVRKQNVATVVMSRLMARIAIALSILSSTGIRGARLFWGTRGMGFLIGF